MGSAVETSLRRRREAIVGEHVDAENRHNVDGVIATFHRPRYDALPLQAVFDGADAVHGLLSSIFAGFSDWHDEILTTRHTDDAVIVETRMTGTHDGTRAGIPATARPIDVQVACIFEFEDDRLMCEKIYFDLATMLQQLGVMPPLPAA